MDAIWENGFESRTAAAPNIGSIAHPERGTAPQHLTQPYNSGKPQAMEAAPWDSDSL